MQDITIGQRVFLAMCKGGSSGVTGSVTGFADKYGVQYVTVEKAGRHYSAPVDHVQEA